MGMNILFNKKKLLGHAQGKQIHLNIMEMSNFNITLGLNGYSTTAIRKKKEERYPNESVIIMEGFETGLTHDDGKAVKVARKFTLSSNAANLLGLQGKKYEPTEQNPHELIYFGHAIQDGTKRLFVINATNSDNEVVRSGSCRATKNFSFSNKDFYSDLCEIYEIAEGTEVVFNVIELDSSLVNGMPIIMIEGVREADQVDGEEMNEDPSEESFDETNDELATNSEFAN